MFKYSITAERKLSLDTYKNMKQVGNASKASEIFGKIITKCHIKIY